MKIINKYIIESLTKHKWLVVSLLVCLTAKVLIESFFALSIKFIIDNAITPHNLTMLLLILGGLVGAVLLSSLVSLARDFIYAKLRGISTTYLYNKFFAHLQYLPLGYFATTSPGEIYAHFSTDFNGIDILITSVVPTCLLALLTVLINVIILFNLKWDLALFALAGLIVSVIGPSLLKSRTSEANDSLKADSAQGLAIVQESINAQRLIKSFGLQKRLIGQYEEQAAVSAKLITKTNFLNFIMEWVPNSCILIFHYSAVAIGAWAVFHGAMSVGSLVSFETLFISLSASVKNVTAVLPSIMDVTAGMKRIGTFLAEKSQAETVESGIHLPEFRETIRFNDVSFSYQQQNMVLKKVNIVIPKGARVAFVGPSGSGKNTLISLLLRFYEPTQGRIEIDGITLTGIREDSLRSLLGVVFRENFLFNTSVEANLKLVKSEATAAEIEQAAAAVELENFIKSLPNGYQTSVGEGGRFFSGGQRQRIALARALINNPAILVLNEATSALDPASEAAINATLKKIAAGRTIIAVTHRLSSIKDYDKIFVIDKGRIVEEGDHPNLLAEGGLYKHLWDKQSGFSINSEANTAAIELAKLRQIKIFAPLESSFLESVSKLLVTENVSENRIVINQGDAADKFYIIVRGLVAVTKVGKDNTEIQIGVLEDGDYFGEIALLRNVTRTATVKTLAPSIFLTLKQESFRKLLSSAPDIRNILERECELRMGELAEMELE